MPRSILTQRQQWDLLRFADTGNSISAGNPDDVDNPAAEQGTDAFAQNNTPAPPGAVKQPSVLQDSVWSKHNTPAGGAAGPAGVTPPGTVTQTPGTGVGAGGAAPAGGDAAGWKQRIKTDITPQLQQRGITDPAAQQKAVDAIYQQGITESGWRDIPQSPSTNDVNMQKGTPAQSYLQYVPSTFEHAQDLAGTPQGQRNIHDPDQQIKGVIPLEESEGKFGPGGFSDSTGSGVGYGHGWG